MIDDVDVRRLAGRLPGGDEVTNIARLGEGLDHVTWSVETPGGAWIVRAPTSGDAAERVARARGELAVMQLVRRHLGGWAAPEAVLLDDAAGCTAQRRVPGAALQDLLAAGAVPRSRSATLAGALGRFVGQLAEIDPTDAEAPVRLDDAALEERKAEAPELVAASEEVLGAGRRPAVARFVAAPTPPEPGPGDLVLTHNDLGAEHVLVDPVTVAVNGVIDWSDTAVADPAADIGRLLRDLGPAALEHLLDGVSVTGHGRARFAARVWFYARCTSLEDLAFAVAHRPDLVPYELGNFDRLFPPA